MTTSLSAVTFTRMAGAVTRFTSFSIPSAGTMIRLRCVNNGGNMSRAEREAVHVALSVELERFRKAHRANGGVTH